MADISAQNKITAGYILLENHEKIMIAVIFKFTI